MSLRFFAARTEIWFLLFGIFSLTNPLGLWTILQIVAMSSSERLVRVHGESLPWSSTSFMATIWQNSSLRNISPISLIKIDSGLFSARAQLSISAISATSSSFCLSASLKDFLSSSASQLLLSGQWGSSCPSQLSSPPHDELARFALLVGLNLVSFTSYAKEVQVAIYKKIQTALTGCYGWWSLFCCFELLGNKA